jgi:hypothetical protein
VKISGRKQNSPRFNQVALARFFDPQLAGHVEALDQRRGVAYAALKIGSGKAAGNDGRISPSAVGPPVELRSPPHLKPWVIAVSPWAHVPSGTELWRPSFPAASPGQNANFDTDARRRVAISLNSNEAALVSLAP